MALIPRTLAVGIAVLGALLVIVGATWAYGPWALIVGGGLLALAALLVDTDVK